MLKAVIDTNIIVAGVLSLSQLSASAVLLRAFDMGEFILVQSIQCIAELRGILRLPGIRAVHSWPDATIDLFCDKLLANSEIFDPPAVTASSVTRDVTDTKFLDLAKAADADYFVTNDRRHLLPLKKIGRTKIVTPHKFMLAVRRSG